MEKIVTKIEKSKNCLPYKRLFDIAANLCDEKFQGLYNGKKYHEIDIEQVLKRAKDYNVSKMLFSAGSILDAHESFKLSQLSNDYYMTVGIHPCRASEAEKESKHSSFEEYYQSISDLVTKYKSKCIAIGECGLDYDRFHYSSLEDQLKHFPIHFDLAKTHNLPMYLHTRNTKGDFIKLVKENRHKFSSGVVHSFTDSLDELNELLKLDLYIGVNGCSLKTKENMEVVKKIPLDKIMLETDAPYCDIKNSHDSYSLIDTHFERVKKEKVKPGLIPKERNEPCMIM
jgi:TatD DNase family protein